MKPQNLDATQEKKNGNNVAAFKQSIIVRWDKIWERGKTGVGVLQHENTVALEQQAGMSSYIVSSLASLLWKCLRKSCCLLDLLSKLINLLWGQVYCCRVNNLSLWKVVVALWRLYEECRHGRAPRHGRKNTTLCSIQTHQLQNNLSNIFIRLNPSLLKGTFSLVSGCGYLQISPDTNSLMKDILGGMSVHLESNVGQRRYWVSVYSEVGEMLVVGGIGAPRIQSASHGAPGGPGGQGIVPATAIHRSLKPVRKKGKVLPSMMRTDEDYIMISIWGLNSRTYYPIWLTCQILALFRKYWAAEWNNIHIVRQVLKTNGSAAGRRSILSDGRQLWTQRSTALLTLVQCAASLWT